MDATVGELENALFNAFPFEDAEDWDQPGLSIGDRSATIKGIAVNLDQTVDAVIAADEAGCNVLVTHHPPFIKGGPTEFGPASQKSTTGPGRVIYEAARRGVHVIAMHTNADRSIAVRQRFANLLGYECLGNFEHLQNPARSARGTGFGALLAPRSDRPSTLASIASDCARIFGGAPRVWGEETDSVTRIALLNGSWNEPDIYDICIAEGIECVVVGETRYHNCIDAKPYLATIELGHDRSELPIVSVLQSAIVEAGFPQDSVTRLHCSDDNWWTPTREK